MSDAALIDQCIAIKKQLTAGLDRIVILELLSGLEHFAVTKDVLRASLIGKTVNDIYKNQTDPVVKDKAKAVVLKWKALLTPKDTPKKPTLSHESSTCGPSAAITVTEIPSEKPRILQKRSTVCLTSFKPEFLAMRNEKGKQRRTEIRKKLLACLKMEVTDMNQDEEAGEQDLLEPEEVVVNMEEELWSQLVKRDDDKNYMTQLRSILYNLKDAKNPNFNYKILTGFHKSEDIPTMTAESMASEVKQAERARHRQESMEEIQSDWALKHGNIKISGMFTCGKCKGTQTTYFQMQTRSSDEPMTTFVTCLTCNNRWKFC